MIENDQAVWEDYIAKHNGETISDDGKEVKELNQESTIMLDRMRRMAGRGEQPYKKWKKLAETRVQDTEDSKLHDVKENMMNDTIEKLLK